jgi:hypothetical protein
MAFQFSTAARNAAADAIEATIGPAPVLEIRTSAPPASCAAADTGAVLATLNLPTDWLAAASAGAKALAGTWQDVSADAAGTAGHFRIKQGATCHIQGTITATGGGGDMTMATTSLSVGLEVNITAFAITVGGA